MSEDWRLNGQENYLLGKRLFKITFYETSGSDHMHCDFCWAKISEHSDDFHNGYATFDGYHIICEECFHDFHEQFHWILDERIKDFEDFQNKWKILNNKYVVIVRTSTLLEKKECELCQKKLEKGVEEKFAICTEDKEHWFCRKCTEDFGPVFNWKQR